MSISPDTIRTLIERYGTSELLPASQTERTALFRADETELAKLMFRLQARELYPQINVLSEPAALNEFRLRVHDAWLINNCTTSRCHGGLDAGRLFLHQRNSKDARVRYTNLLILERLELDPEWPLINYDEPLMSLIIQHALPSMLRASRTRTCPVGSRSSPAATDERWKRHWHGFDRCTSRARIIRWTTSRRRSISRHRSRRLRSNRPTRTAIRGSLLDAVTFF